MGTALLVITGGLIQASAQSTPPGAGQINHSGNKNQLLRSSGYGGLDSLAILPGDFLPKAADDNIPGVVIPASPINNSLNDSSDTVDVFRISLTAGQTISVNMSGPASTDFDMLLFPPGSTNVYTDSGVAGSQGVSYPEEFTYVAANSGTYYLGVYSYSGSGNYTVTYSVVNAPPPPPFPPATGNNKHAVVIGVEDYPGTENDLDYTVDDAQDVKSALINYGGFKENDIYLLTNSSATKANIQNAITNWLQSVDRPGDLDVIFYSGHGTNGSDVAPYDETDGYDEYLFNYDASSYSSMIRDDEMDSWIAPLDSTKVVVSLDSCYSGGFLKSADGFGQKPKFIQSLTSGAVGPKDSFDKDLNKAGNIVMTASNDDEYSYETSTLQNGVFAYYWTEGLRTGTADQNGNALVSAEESFQYLFPKVQSMFPGQTPQLYDGVTGQVDLTAPNPAPAGQDYYWTWYDGFSMQDWVLMANPTGATGSLKFYLSIGGLPQGFNSIGGLTPGEVPVGQTLATQAGHVADGPVKLTSLGGSKAVVSQRSLMGNSFEEVLGADENKLSDHFWWTWYDQLSPGMTNWVLVANPSTADTVHAVIKFTNQANGSVVTSESDIAPGKEWAPTFPGKMGGPVEVKAYRSGGSWPANKMNVIASQRVLSGYGLAFNEVPGIPAGELQNDYLWTWYDQLSTGMSDWVLVANPGDAAVTYQIKIGNEVMPTSTGNPGNIPAHGYVAPTFPDKMDGPVEVTSSASVIATQRLTFGPSFEEVPGYPRSALSSDFHWTWYDQVSAGSRNWVLVTNPGTQSVTYQIKIAGSVMPTSSTNPGTIPAGGKVAPQFPGIINGPVEVIASGNVMVSQRVTWNGYMNEVLGTVLS